ncbi:MAG: hypothetical protein ACOYXW_06590 [Actinomycetota bacterium]
MTLDGDAAGRLEAAVGRIGEATQWEDGVGDGIRRRQAWLEASRAELEDALLR